MQLTADYKQKISRGELLRFFWWFPLAFILYLWGIVIGVLTLVHFVQILIQEKRDKSIHAHLRYFLKYQWQWTLYTFLVDDTQPNWNPFEFIETCKATEKNGKKVTSKKA